MEKCANNRRVSRRRITLAVIVDFIIFLFVGIPNLYLFLRGKPFIRGFHCDDPAISLPFKPDSISTSLLTVAGFGTSILCAVIVEVLNSISRKCVRAWPTWEDLLFYGKSYSLFIIGFVIQMLFVEFVKNQLGFLRPNFMDVCRPQFNVSLCPAFITEYKCIGQDAKEIIGSRQSFPSGHSTFSMYVAVFYCFYIQRRLHISFSRILKFFLQAALVFTASICGMSRIRDHKHHTFDVIAGFAVGAIVAVSVYKLLAEYLLFTSSDDDVSESSTSSSTVSHDLCCACATMQSANVEPQTPAPLLPNDYFNDDPNATGRQTSIKLKVTSPVSSSLTTYSGLSDQQELV